MKHVIKLSLITLLSLLVSLFITLPALAVPVLPSSYYGTIKVNAAKVPDGTTVQALIDGQVYGETVTLTYQGDSVYAVDVLGDDSDTTAKDGGREGDPIQFKIGGVLVDQTGTWHSGTNVNLNLTASSSEPVATPEPTSILVPTQTPILLVEPTALPATATQPVLATATAVQPAQVTTAPDQSASSSAVPVNATHKGSGNSATVVATIAVVGIVAILVGYYFLVFRKKKM